MTLYNYFKTIIYGVVTPTIVIFGFNCIIKYTFKNLVLDFMKNKMAKVIKESIKNGIEEHLLNLKDNLKFNK